MTDARGNDVISVIRGTNKARWDRVLLKLSGEAFAGQSSYGIDGPVVPFFPTDPPAALRAVEVEAGALLKGTQVDGVYTADPKLDPNATKLDQITYMDVLQRDLRVMDHTATTLCMENRLPIVVFDLMKPGNVRSLLDGQ